MTPEEKAKALHGKQIIWIDEVHGNVEYEAFILCDPKIGITVKPLDPEAIPKFDDWIKPPEDPNFYLYCFYATREDRENDFDLRVERFLSNDKSSASKTIGKASLGFGSCPFSS